jgi:exopolyphosphatase / guanosine-5'-triphosphate,3'-diphosphate pyrophosphatase
VDVSVLDLGSHSFQLLCARSLRSGRVERLHKDVEFVQLTNHLRPDGSIDADGFAAGIKGVIELLARAPEFARKRPLIGVATCAIREASNGGAFLTALEQATGVTARALPGEEAASLAYAGAASEFEGKPRRMAVVDLGGGSTELAWGNGKQLLHGVSVRLGVMSLVERLASMPNTANMALDQLAVFVTRSLEPVVYAARQDPPQLLVFASGVARVIQALAISYELALPGAPITARSLRALIPLLLEATPAELQARGVPSQRVKTTGPTAIVLDVVCELFEKEEFTVVRGGLREGVVLNARAMSAQAWPRRSN